MSKYQTKRKNISCTIVGDRKVGKSWLSMAFAQGCFPMFSKYTETFLEPLAGKFIYYLCVTVKLSKDALTENRNCL